MTLSLGSVTFLIVFGLVGIEEALWLKLNLLPSKIEVVFWKRAPIAMRILL